MTRVFRQKEPQVPAPYIPTPCSFKCRRGAVTGPFLAIDESVRTVSFETKLGPPVEALLGIESGPHDPPGQKPLLKWSWENPDFAGVLIVVRGMAIN
jgi:hypothetical protein